VYIKNNQIDVRSENESYEFKEDNVLPVGGAYLLSSFENALLRTRNPQYNLILSGITESFKWQLFQL
jgi:hypothetical protein